MEALRNSKEWIVIVAVAMRWSRAPKPVTSRYSGITFHPIGWSPFTAAAPLSLSASPTTKALLRARKQCRTPALHAPRTPPPSAAARIYYVLRSLRRDADGTADSAVAIRSTPIRCQSKAKTQYESIENCDEPTQATKRFQDCRFQSYAADRNLCSHKTTCSSAKRGRETFVRGPGLRSGKRRKMEREVA